MRVRGSWPERVAKMVAKVLFEVAKMVEEVAEMVKASLLELK